MRRENRAHTGVARRIPVKKFNVCQPPHPLRPAPAPASLSHGNLKWESRSIDLEVEFPGEEEEEVEEGGWEGNKEEEEEKDEDGEEEEEEVNPTTTRNVRNGSLIKLVGGGGGGGFGGMKSQEPLGDGVKVNSEVRGRMGSRWDTGSLLLFLPPGDSLSPPVNLRRGDRGMDGGMDRRTDGGPRGKAISSPSLPP